MTRRWPSPHQRGDEMFRAWWRFMRRLITDGDHRWEMFAQMITIEEAQHWTEMLEGRQV